jgi:hypothetical protein
MRKLLIAMIAGGFLLLSGVAASAKPDTGTAGQGQNGQQLNQTQQDNKPAFAPATKPAAPTTTKPAAPTPTKPTTTAPKPAATNAECGQTGDNTGEHEDLNCNDQNEQAGANESTTANDTAETGGNSEN